MTMYFVYIITSLCVNRCYTGVTTDLTRRLGEHNSGNTKATRPFGPWRLLYFEEFDDKSAAYKREYFLKSPSGNKEKRKIIASRG